MTVLDSSCLVGEALADVNVLRSVRTLSARAADDVVAPFNARVVVFVDRRPFLRCEPHTAQEVSEVSHLNGRCRC